MSNAKEQKWDLEEIVQKMSQIKSIGQQLGVDKNTLEESKKRIMDVENRCSKAVAQSQELEVEIKSTKRVLALGLDVPRMENLIDTVKRIAAKHGVPLSQAVEKFFTDLAEYDEQVGFEKRKSELEISISREESRLESLKVEYETYRAAVDAVIPLLQSGTKPSDLAYLCRLIQSEKIDIPALSADLSIHTSLGPAVVVKKIQVRELEASVKKLTAQRDQLGSDVANIEADRKRIAEETRSILARIGEAATIVTRSTVERVNENLKRNFMALEDMQTTTTGVQRTVLSDFKRTMELAREYRRLILFEPLARAEAGEHVELRHLYEAGIYAMEIVARYVPSSSLARTSIDETIAIMKADMSAMKVLSELDEYDKSAKKPETVKYASEMGLKMLKPGHSGKQN